MTAETPAGLSGAMAVARRFDLRSVRGCEWLLLAYFIYAAAFSAGDAWEVRAGSVAAGACIIFVLAWVEVRTGSLLVSCVRDWLPAALVLVAYWSVDWFQAPQGPTAFDKRWIGLDQLLLRTWGFKAAVESAGPVVPGFLELCYGLLYTVTPVSVGILYLYRRRRRVDRFLSTLLFGTLTTYVLLPHFPSLSPWVAFPGQDLPAYHTPFRSLNMWLLSNCDIHNSVFPSGHVTLGFSAAFAMFVAMPERRYLGVGLLLLACVVMIATVYGRYHYTVDGLAGIAISLLALAVTSACRRGRRAW